MRTQSFLKWAAWVFLLAGLAGLGIAVADYVGGGSLADYGSWGSGGTFWMFCSAVAFFLRARLR